MASTFTLNNCEKYLQDAKYAPASVQAWKPKLKTIATKYYGKEVKDDQDIKPMLYDTKKVIDIIEGITNQRDESKEVGVSTIKHYYFACVVATQPAYKDIMASPIANEKVSSEYKVHRDKYQDKETAAKDTNKPKGAVEMYPELNWTEVQKIYADYVKSNMHTKNNLRNMVFAGFYLLEVPRRVEDYELLKLSLGKPPKEPLQDQNILYLEKRKATISIAKWKSSERKGKRINKVFVRTLSNELFVLVKKYVEAWDMSEGDHIFCQKLPDKKVDTETGNLKAFYKPYSRGKLTDALKDVFYVIYKREKITANSFRHWFKVDFLDKYSSYNDQIRKDIMERMGDTPSNIPTAMQYAVQNQENAGLSYEEI